MKLKVLTTKELRSKKPAELTAYITEMKKNYVEFVHAVVLNKEKQTHQAGVMRRAIAQAKTIQAEMRQEEEK